MEVKKCSNVQKRVNVSKIALNVLVVHIYQSESDAYLGPSQTSMMDFFYGNKQPQPTITCSKLTTEILEQGVKYCYVNFEHISHLVLVFLLLALSR